MKDKEFFDSDTNDVLESERMEILLEVYEKLRNERSYTTGELLWDEEWLKERLFGENEL